MFKVIKKNLNNYDITAVSNEYERSHYVLCYDQGCQVHENLKGKIFAIRCLKMEEDVLRLNF